MRKELQRILADAVPVDDREALAGRPGAPRLGQAVPAEPMREILGRGRQQLVATQQAAKPPPPRLEGDRPAGEDPASRATGAPAAGAAKPTSQGRRPHPRWSRACERAGKPPVPQPWLIFDSLALLLNTSLLDTKRRAAVEWL